MRIGSWGLALLAIAAFSAAAFGGPAPAGEASSRAIQVVLYPAPAPRPALKYQLLPTFFERHPGNAAVRWNRIPAGREDFLAKFSQEFEKPGRLPHWVDDIPLGDPRERAYREKEAARGIQFLRDELLFDDMEWAAQMNDCDWELPIRKGRYMSMLLPEVQRLRAYGRWLYCRAHLEIAEGRYDAALRTLKAGLSLARQTAAGECLISPLVGITIARSQFQQVRDMLQRPDAPNLYWALSSLPQPFVDLRPACEAESQSLYLQFPELRGLDKKNLSADEWYKLLETVVEVTGRCMDPGSPRNTACNMDTALRGHETARRGLIERGWTAAEVAAMPAAQAVLLYSVRLFDEIGDIQYGLLFLPAAEAVAQRNRAEREWRKAVQSEVIPLAKTFTGPIGGVKPAELRLEGEVAMLRVLEALRLYAAGHDGRWPDRLTDITEVPVPVNPFDGKPFAYERQGDRAVLKGEGPYAWHYEITFKQREKQPAAK